MQGLITRHTWEIFNSLEKCCCFEMDKQPVRTARVGDQCLCWTLKQQHEWDALKKAWGSWILSSQQLSAHQDETAVNVRIALWIPKVVPLQLPSKLPPALSSAVQEAPHEPQHRPAAALHLGTHTQVVLMMRSLWCGYYMIRMYWAGLQKL